MGRSVGKGHSHDTRLNTIEGTDGGYGRSRGHWDCQRRHFAVTGKTKCMHRADYNAGP